MQTIGTLELPPTPMHMHGSWGARDVGTHGSTMTLYEDNESYFIEWDIPALEATETIGLVFDDREAVTLIRQYGFTVPEDFAS